jgi:hypothetical protein
MQPNEIVTAIMITFAVLYLMFEIIFNLNDIDGDTSNIIILEWSRGKFFFIPFALGAICGHLFLGTRNSAFKMPNSMFAVLILFVLAVITIIIGHKFPFKKSKNFLTALLLLGVLYGHFFWSMNYLVLTALK